MLAAVSALMAVAAAASEPMLPAASLSHDPLVLRLSKDEFRIAFGISAQHCGERGCHGVIRYRVAWWADDGSRGDERKQVGYVILPRSTRSITVDRQYFDTAEAEHTTEVTQVDVEQITCYPGASAPWP